MACLVRSGENMNIDCTNDLVVAVVAVLVAVVPLINLITGYYRHEHLKSDNKRLLHVIEAKTATVSDVK